ncbi:MAG: CRISPR-associated helicase Cas3' [Sphaerobacter sp.]|nr:CRISPR-associated helicase Cas3' [Sphaerobacter sp.]
MTQGGEAPPFAHSRNVVGERQPLVDHVRGVASLAAAFAAPYAGDQLAYWAGLWHDLGKFHPQFQRYLREAETNSAQRPRGPSHKAAGACLAARHPVTEALALVIAGHHGGLPDRDGTLRQLLADACGTPLVAEALARAEDAIPELIPTDPPKFPGFVNTHLRLELFLRMLFSALVDADFLDTEQHFRPEISARRTAMPIGELWDRFAADQAARFPTSPVRAVDQVRAEVYQACLAAASQAPGFFRLTVPTGGGKTRSGLAFALRHAQIHDLRRVIVAVPYTSITEQTAAVYREIFPEPGIVLEHHSAVQVAERGDGALPDWARLAAENWDAPVIVTTTVQLFESLLGCSPTACRKLHNIARSVVILDEVQALPPGLLDPILDVLRDLVAHYGVTVVLCTATQPALDPRSGFPGLPGIREIVPEPARLFARLPRVRYETRLEERWSWERAAEELRTSPQALAIVNTKRGARDLFRALGDPDALHLSTLLCGAHRRDVLDELRRRLAAGEPCRLVSTQVVEAGVDLDFPLVLRALGPLDRIVQAAGRCNREGTLPTGRVVVFVPQDEVPPPGAYRTATDTTRGLLADPAFDFHDPAVYETYFRRYYQGITPDAKHVQAARRSLNYPDVASRFRLIDDGDAVPVVVRYRSRRDGRSAEDLLAELRRAPEDARRLWRQLQPYVVNLRARMLETARRDGLVVEVAPGLWEWTGDYDDRLGLLAGAPDPERWVV